MLEFCKAQSVGGRLFTEAFFFSVEWSLILQRVKKVFRVFGFSLDYLFGKDKSGVMGNSQPWEHYGPQFLNSLAQS